MRIKSAWMRTGDELSEKHRVNATHSVDEIIYGVTEEEGYNDPDMAMDVDPYPGLSFESPFSTPSSSPWGQNQNPRSNSRTAPRPLVLDRVKPALHAAEGRYFDHHSRIEHLHKWHREHFSPEDDLDRSHTMAY
ncbi:hypothetical protein M407DRAFT_241208 [Tulasnella calospora MUT 4182]|uniref:Uncharacterized protein n=1 Tax=Tulasnella calospora MUT 4182 TaxID=1051891 RepID=A0A0C3QKD5_9AGAM|nr:hypothetical protein M407DRAFT_241208 [Tulasnella calospora MUT 4182]